MVPLMYITRTPLPRTFLPGQGDENTDQANPQQISYAGQRERW
jgi:hypothetical protein